MSPQEFPYFTEEHEMIRQTVKRFCRQENAPYAEEWDLAGIFPREIFSKAADLGLFGIRIDPEWGGRGQGWWATAAYPAARDREGGGVWRGPAVGSGCPAEWHWRRGGV